MSRPSETALLTALALVAFASNSILTRLALGAGAMDAATFTTVRLLAGAVRAGGDRPGPGADHRPRRGGGRGLIGPVALFAYAAPFSFAYVRIGAAAGALLLFGAGADHDDRAGHRQRASGRGCGVGRHRRWRRRAWLADAARRSAARSDRQRADGRRRMRVGRLFARRPRRPNALAANARSFVWAVPLAVVVNLAAASSVEVSARGLVLAVVVRRRHLGARLRDLVPRATGLTATQAGDRAAQRSVDGGRRGRRRPQRGQSAARDLGRP